MSEFKDNLADHEIAEAAYGHVSKHDVIGAARTKLMDAFYAGVRFARTQLQDGLTQASMAAEAEARYADELRRQRDALRAKLDSISTGEPVTALIHSQF